MDKQEKEQIVAEIREKLDKANGLYITDFHGLTVEQTNNLRSDFWEAKVDYKVVKNTLLKRALTEKRNASEKTDLSANLPAAGGSLAQAGRFSKSTGQIIETLKGQTGIIFTYDDPLSPAKILKKHFEKLEKPKLKIAVIEDVSYDSSKLNELASMPTKLEVIASIVGSLHSPISGIVNAVNALMRDLASVIEEAAAQAVANATKNKA